MVWDLRGALLKKGEVESARLDDFEFRLRARTMRLLAPLVDPAIDPAELVKGIAKADDEELLASLGAAYPALGPAAIKQSYVQCRTEARRQLIAELGDPTPYKLA